MHHCPKCNLQFPDTSKICRSCGAILETLPDEPPAPAASVADDSSNQSLAARIVDSALELPVRDSVSADHWICTKCGESVPAAFEICWNCEADPGLVDREPATANPADEGAISLTETAPKLRCAACGSDKMIPDVHVADQGQYSSGHLSTVIAADPDAIIFKHRMWARLVADICGACGHVQLRAENPQGLYEHYERSKSD